MKTTYYTKPRTYGGRYFILANATEKKFSRGMTGSCVCSKQWTNEAVVDSLTQKQLNQIEQALLNSGYEKISNEDYYNLGLAN
ncbi:MAG: hypothetical protein HXO06_00700 [Prevotella salivae]|uniref:hypothetical protein n=1 Tax=Segatella salivae TaxID=228604 RepID=UPI001CB06CE8|nr:hypothetical protein [Segatella salivae]MBF1543696.1 hypothetical protein [Segatella salivae]